MKYYIIAGEASGDLHASNLILEIKKNDPSSIFRCWGGDLMKRSGAEIVKHISELAFMGFTEVILNLRKILRSIDFCKEDLLEFKPDVLILVDYPGFNLRIAEFAAKHKIRVVYYISPQVWAWKSSRVKRIKRSVRKMITILPFEKAFYQKFGMNVEFVGHPLLDEIAKRLENKPAFSQFTKDNLLSEKPIIAILPGSRKQEIDLMLPVMASVARDYPDYQFVVACMAHHDLSYYQKLIGDFPVKLIGGKTYNLLEQSTAALVTSGTATLETALFEVPEVVCYKGGALSFQIAKMLVKVDFISLVNLIMEEELVTELIQSNFTKEKLKVELQRILFDSDARQRQLDGYKNLKSKLGGAGASKKAAEIINQLLTEDKN